MPFLRNEFSKLFWGPFYDDVIYRDELYLWSYEENKLKKNPTVWGSRPRIFNSGEKNYVIKIVLLNCFDFIARWGILFGNLVRWVNLRFVGAIGDRKRDKNWKRRVFAAGDSDLPGRKHNEFLKRSPKTRSTLEAPALSPTLFKFDQNLRKFNIRHLPIHRWSIQII